MARYSILAVFAVAVTAQTQSWWGQCGGIGYSGVTPCATGATCTTLNSWYAQCTPTPVTQSGLQTLYGQCGGIGYTSSTKCAPGGFCSTQNPYYAQCTPNALSNTGASTPMSTTAMTTTSKSVSSTLSTSTVKSVSTTSTTSTTASSATSKASSTSTTGSKSSSSSVSTSSSQSSSSSTTSSKSTTTSSTSTSSKSTTTSSTSTSTSATATPTSTGNLTFAGVNIAGCDFGVDIYGNAGTSGCPTSTGPSQMTHFTTTDHFNIFRLPVGWQYLVANTLGGSLDPSYFSAYDALVQSCLSTGAHCLIDIHNYARWNGQIIGQSNGTVTNAHFTSLWSQLATKYKSQSAVIFGLMNEPHGVNITTWAATVQAAVTAIRATGATSQLILLPGTDFTSAATFSTASAPYLASVTDSDGSTTRLIYDIHRYFDSDGSGSSPECVTDSVSGTFAPLATYLRQHGRKALLSEMGGGGTSSCLQYVCSALSYLSANSDVYLGFAGWAAGSFPSDPNKYPLTQTPINGTDQPLVSGCLAKYV